MLSGKRKLLLMMLSASVAFAGWAGTAPVSANEAAARTVTDSRDGARNPGAPPSSRQDSMALGGSQIPSFAQVDGIVKIPTQAMVVIETQGRIVVATDNGRFVVEGVIYDLWDKKVLRSLDEVRRAAYTIDLEKLGLKLDDLGPIVFGREDAPRVVLVVTPGCPQCQVVLKEAEALAEQYRFVVLMVGTGRDEDGAIVRMLSCPADREVALKALLSGDYGELKQARRCDYEPIIRRHLAVQLLGIDMAPFVIAPNGRIHRGPPKGLKAWLADAGGAAPVSSGKREGP